jgi:hypothetical protein
MGREPERGVSPLPGPLLRLRTKERELTLAPDIGGAKLRLCPNFSDGGRSDASAVVAQASEPAVSQVSKPAGCWARRRAGTFDGKPIGNRRYSSFGKLRYAIRARSCLYLRQGLVEGLIFDVASNRGDWKSARVAARRRSAGLRACRIAGFQTCRVLGETTRWNI